MQTFKQPNGAADTSHDYKEAVTYDPNGNIKTYLRNGASSDRGLTMDNLSYNYNVSGGRLQKNQLVRVTDAATGMYTEDIKTQTNAVNYEYDAIGNLIKDKQDSIDLITWTVYGKIESITKLNGSTLHYTYDASGNRIEKKYSKAGVDHYTWYVRDAQGNTMAVYEKKGTTAVRLTESHLYGSSRLGMVKELTKAPVNISTSPIIIEKYTFTRGEKFFELTNHLGNVLAVVADKKLPVKATIDNSINFWLADVVTASGYYPFGMPMPGRNGIAFQSDWVPGRGFVAGSSYPDYLQVSSRPYAPTPNAYRAGKEVELLPGFETATATDELLVEIQAGSGVLSNDYPGGQGSNDMYGYYRYGFNGKENDNEVKGTGNQQDYGMRIYDMRLGRFLSVDPLTPEYPWYTPYQFAGNKPIQFIDRDGEEEEDVTKYWENQPQIDINKAPKTGKTNSAGYTRNGLYVARQQFAVKPEMFSLDMQASMNINRMPLVDDNWIKFNPEHAVYKGRALIHHHIEGQNMTVLIPDKLHYDKYGALHAYLKNKVGGSIRGAVGRVGTALSVVGFLSMLNFKNPDSWVNSFGAWGDPDDNIGKVLKDPTRPEGGLYLVIEKVTNIYENVKGKNGSIEKRLKSKIVEGTWYSDYIKDVESGEYKGINKIQDAKETWDYDEKGNRKITNSNTNILTS